VTGERPRTLSIRAWLGLALASLFLVPFMTMAIIGFIVFAPTEGPRDIDREIGTYVTGNANRWQDASWQDELRARYGDDTDIVLMVDGQEVFRTADPLVDDTTNTVHKVAVRDTDPVQTAYIYTDQQFGPPQELRQWFVPVAVFSALLLTLAGIAWFLRRSIVQPLESTSDAARRVARGELDIALPSSRVREVAELNQAFESMSDDLRASLEHRAAMEQERRLFISAIAHDLRTPLFSLRGSLQGLEQGIAASPAQREGYIRIALRKADQLERLIADLFTFTRMEYMEDKPVTEPLNLGPFLQALVESTRPRANEKGIALTLDGSGASPTVNADPHMLTRALENLLDNALRHTPQGGTIRVAWREAPETTEVSVTDSGPGFADQDLPHLFEPLYRGDTSRSRETGGAGLGLTIAQRIITAHGGTLTATNAPSGGAHLTIILPA
jgi:signal transduction histidine kinase